MFQRVVCACLMSLAGEKSCDSGSVLKRSFFTISREKANKEPGNEPGQGQDPIDKLSTS